MKDGHQDNAWSEPMSPIRWSATLLALLTVTPGCTDSPGDGRKLVPVMTDRGIITYRYEDEMAEQLAKAQTSSGFDPTRPPQLVATNRRGDEQILQEIRDHRRNLND